MIEPHDGDYMSAYRERIDGIRTLLAPQNLRHFMQFRNRKKQTLLADKTLPPIESEATPIETNLALGRPATQSSVSIWSNFPTAESDASGANNGQIDGLAGFHTDSEAFPWWQVDLQSTCMLRAVRLFNRQQCAWRLRQFDILSSIDGVKWMTLHRKIDDAIFGATDLEP